MNIYILFTPHYFLVLLSRFTFNFSGLSYINNHCLKEMAMPSCCDYKMAKDYPHVAKRRSHVCTEKIVADFFSPVNCY